MVSTGMLGADVLVLTVRRCYGATKNARRMSDVLARIASLIPPGAVLLLDTLTRQVESARNVAVYAAVRMVQRAARAVPAA